MKLLAILACLRAPQPRDTVTVTLTGTRAAVLGLARHLSTVTTVLGMAHRPDVAATGPDGQPVIRLDLAIQHPTGRRP